MRGPAVTATPQYRAGLFTRYWPEFVAVLLLLCARPLVSGETLGHDVVWQFWVARQLNAGIPLYSWIAEVNPPLWYWMAQPVDLLAAMTDQAPLDLLCTSIFVLIGISLTCCAMLIAPLSAQRRAVIYTAILAVMLLVALPDFAQREHLVLIAAFPYALLISCRDENRSLPTVLVLAIALLATPAFALKHYFALIPIMLEIWLIWRRKRSWQPFRLETVALAAGAISYLGAILAVTPDYIATIVPALHLVYGDARMSILTIMVTPMNMLLLIVGLYVLHFRRELGPGPQAALATAAALGIAYFLQFKGWSYHALPVIGMLVAAMALHLTQRPETPRLRWPEYLTVGLTLLIAIVPPLQQGQAATARKAEVDRLLVDASPGMNVALFATHSSGIWPMVDQWGLVWTTRYYHFWMMEAVIDTRMAGKPLEGPLLNLVTRIRRDTVTDLSCHPPDILIDDGTIVDTDQRDILDFFKEEPTFAALMKAYEASSTLGRFTVYHRVGQLPPTDGPCMNLAPARHIYPRPGAQT